MKHIKIKFQFLAIIIYSIIFQSFASSQTSYLTDDDFVPLFAGINVDNTRKDVFWDLSEINNNGRLDLVAGIKQRGNHISNIYNYDHGNWYWNQYDTNFNGENVNYRFIYAEGTDANNGITGLLFAKLNSSSSIYKEVVVTREDNKMYIFPNNNGIIQSSTQNFTVQGSVAAEGKFSNDNIEDVAVISGSLLKIYKGTGSSTLDSNVLLTLHNVNATKVIIAQVSSWIEPYATFKQTTNDKDEIVVRTGANIKIYKNNNSNGILDSTTISISSQFADFKIADVNDDGYNDLIVASLSDGIKVFLNNTGTISSTASYTNTNYNVQNLDIADFNKDGWNDIVAAAYSTVYLFLNSSGSFSQTVSYSKNSSITSLNGRKLAAADLHNKGGLSVLFSGTGNISDSSESPDYPWEYEDMVRFNALTKDANPSPAIIFGEVVYVGYYNRPKLYLYSRGDRDFLRFRIYKKSPYVGNVWTLIDSTSSDNYIDYNEIVYNGGGSGDHTLYYTKVVDNSYKVSINSDTLDFETICPSCGSGERPLIGTELPTEYSITNYPNPFNPSTKIYYTLPIEGKVRIEIYNLLGQKVIELVNEFKQAGAYTIEFDGANLSSGIYYYRIESKNFVATKKMLLLK